MSLRKEILNSYFQDDPQVDSHGHLKYLVACGASLQMVGLSHRQISDLDLVVVNGNLDYLLSLIGVDARLPENFWGNLALTNQFLIETSVGVNYGATSLKVVHPAITLAQKEISDIGFPREKDRLDAVMILQMLRHNPIFYGWEEIYQFAAASRQ